MWWWSQRGRVPEADDAAPAREEAAADPSHRPGEPLDPATRTRMERALGLDLGDVRVHHDSEAATIARAAGANAMTSGRDVYFAAGTYAPQSAAGEALLAHELTHVVQQSDATGESGGEAHEREADAVGEHVAAGRGAPPVSMHAAPGAAQLQQVPGTIPDFKLKLSFETVRIDDFDSGKSTLKEAHKKTLDDAAKTINDALITHPDTFVSITGFTDAVDTEKNNKKLGQDRADATLEYLASKGVPRAVMRAGSLGEEMLLVETEKAEPRNRRVDVHIHRRSLLPKITLGLPPLTLEKPKPVPPVTITLPPSMLPPTPPTTQPDLSKILSPEYDEMIRRYREMKPEGKSVADLGGQFLRDVAKKLGLPKSIQDKAEEIGKELPGKAGAAAVDQLPIGDAEKEALKKAIEALSKTPSQ